MSVEADLQFAFALINELQGALGGERIIRGTVSSAGAIVAGNGFTVVKNSTGDYSVFFTTAFTGLPSVTLGLGSTATNPRGIKITDGVPVTEANFRVWTYTVAPTLADAEFHFIAVGP